jgi:hypothetical protein
MVTFFIELRTGVEKTGRRAEREVKRGVRPAKTGETSRKYGLPAT